MRANAPWAEVVAEDVYAEKVIYGNFYTVDKKQPRAEAVAIFGGHFVYVGDADGVKALIGKSTKVERYEGGLIVPGMSDGHCHCSVGGTVELFEANLLKVFDIDEFMGRIKALIEKHPEYEVYQGFGFAPLTELYGVNGPTADMLDGLSDKPIVIADLAPNPNFDTMGGVEGFVVCGLTEVKTRYKVSEKMFRVVFSLVFSLNSQCPVF